jgi:hypothetical protein
VKNVTPRIKTVSTFIYLLIVSTSIIFYLTVTISSLSHTHVDMKEDDNTKVNIPLQMVKTVVMKMLI